MLKNLRYLWHLPCTASQTRCRLLYSPLYYYQRVTESHPSTADCFPVATISRFEGVVIMYMRRSPIPVCCRKDTKTQSSVVHSLSNQLLLVGTSPILEWKRANSYARKVYNLNVTGCTTYEHSASLKAFTSVCVRHRSWRFSGFSAWWKSTRFYIAWF